MKIKQKYKHLTMTARWLKQQIKRDDVIGDLAQDFVLTRSKIPGKGTYNDWFQYLLNYSACEGAFKALR